MKRMILILTLLILTGCKMTFSTPMYQVGDEVIVNDRLTGVVVNVTNYTGKNNTSDYRVMFEMGAAEWYDEEILKLRR